MRSFHHPISGKKFSLQQDRLAFFCLLGGVAVFAEDALFGITYARSASIPFSASDEEKVT